MEHPLQRLWNKPERLVIGFMSGTSADGVDAALVRISGYGVETRLTQLAFCFTPFDEATRAEVLRLAGGGSAAAADFCRINFHLGQLYCEAGDALCRQAGIERAQVDLIGCHGQTLWHIPQEEIYLGRSQHSTFQLGESAMLAEYFGCPTVGDFRVRDVAAGGLGAPLVPYTEFLLYRSREECVALQNIGGIGNVTVLPRDCRLEDVFAFDTGPGNMIIDAVTAAVTGGRQTYDAGGAIAARGHTNEALLARLRENGYYALPLPKTTGRERFGAQYTAEMLAWPEANGLSPEDLLATVTELTAWSIADAYERYVLPHARADELIAGGGGSYNQTLLRMLERRFAVHGIRVMTQENLGFSSDAKEAVAFALLADCCRRGCANVLPGVTGAWEAAVLGKLSLPPQRGAGTAFGCKSTE